MNGTGSCWKGASRQIWVATSTSPASLSPFEAISTSVATQANVAVAPSASDARAILSRGAPMAPNRPIMPSALLASPFFVLTLCPFCDVFSTFFFPPISRVAGDRAIRHTKSGEVLLGASVCGTALPFSQPHNVRPSTMPSTSIRFTRFFLKALLDFLLRKSMVISSISTNDVILDEAHAIEKFHHALHGSELVFLVRVELYRYRLCTFPC